MGEHFTMWSEWGRGTGHSFPGWVVAKSLVVLAGLPGPCPPLQLRRFWLFWPRARVGWVLCRDVLGDGGVVSVTLVSAVDCGGGRGGGPCCWGRGPIWCVGHVYWGRLSLVRVVKLGDVGLLWPE